MPAGSYGHDLYMDQLCESALHDAIADKREAALRRKSMRKNGYVQFVDGNKITVDGEKYSAFAVSQIKCRVGDYVDFEYIEKPGVTRAGTAVVYKNIKGDVLPSTGSPAVVGGATIAAPRVFTPPPTKVGEPILAKDRLILRQNALTAAVNHTNSTGFFTNVPSLDEAAAYVIEVAKKFEYYTSGDMDYDAAEKALEGDKVD